jgi:hypothetical protein
MFFKFSCSSRCMSEFAKWRVEGSNRRCSSLEYSARILGFHVYVTVCQFVMISCGFVGVEIELMIIRLFSDEGRSFSFDSRGTGYGRGEGCGMVILKPLEQALKDNDTIRAVIVGSGINQDGKTPGITMPNGTAQGMFNPSISPRSG